MAALPVVVSPSHPCFPVLAATILWERCIHSFEGCLPGPCSVWKPNPSLRWGREISAASPKQVCSCCDVGLLNSFPWQQELSFLWWFMGRSSSSQFSPAISSFASVLLPAHLQHSRWHRLCLLTFKLIYSSGARVLLRTRQEQGSLGAMS